MNNLIILGSGRSGTSMITGALSEADYFMGEQADYLGRNKANPKGFYEDKDINLINEDILALHLFNIPEKIRSRFFPSYTFYHARWLSSISVSKEIEKSTGTIGQRIQKITSTSPFCFKDPRFSYTLPIWKKYLSSDTKFLVVFREPIKTAESIIRECSESKELNRLKMNQKNALKNWIAMYGHVLKNYKKDPNKNNWMFIHYDQIFIHEIQEKLMKFTEASIDFGFAEKNISRSKGVQINHNSKAEGVYEELCKLSSYKVL